MSPLASILTQHKVLVSVGSGGVGKTTVSAALALRAAHLGKSALVCTIDPARRLANALGVSSLGNTQKRIDDAPLKEDGVTLAAPMSAMMLDQKRSWDELIFRHVPEGKREKILNNRFYQSLSTALAGSQEYIAMEKLWQLRNEATEDLLVLDTPPTVHALDFLEAPNRLLDFLDHDVAKLLMVPALTAGRFGLKLFNLGGNFIAKTLSKFTGVETLQEMAGFLLAMEGMNDGFRQRAKETRALLSSKQTAFILVTSPSSERLDETEHFYRVLQEHHMNVAAIVVNRVHLPIETSVRNATENLAGPLREKMRLTLQEADILAANDSNGLSKLRKWSGNTAVVEVPRFSLDVHDLRSLWKIGQYLLGEKHVAR